MEYIDEDFYYREVYLQESLHEGFITEDEYNTKINEIKTEADNYYRNAWEEYWCTHSNYTT